MNKKESYMIQFDLNRFGRLARWSLTMDKRYYVKSTLSWTVMLTLLFLFFTCVVNFDNHYDGLQAYQSCTMMVVVMLLVIVVLGGAFMFQNMKDKHDDQRLLMLPVSNLEKFLMRYSTWLLLLPCLLVSFVAADMVQWLVNTLLGHEYTMLVMQYISNATFGIHWASDIPRALRFSIVLTFFWLHSSYLLGATFFRSHKYNWILTSAVLIVGGILLGMLFPNDYLANRIDESTAISLLNVGNGAYLLLTVFNFWLSYRLFCRTQLVGRFINI